MNDDRKSNTEQPAEASDSKTEDDASQRRRSLRKILIGAGALSGAVASGKWTEPIVDSVLLPAHAGFSDPDPS